MKLNRLPLLARILIAIFLGIVLGRIMPLWTLSVFTTFNALFSSFLKFLIPLIIVGLVMPAIADIGRSAGRLLVVTVAIAYCSTVFSGLFSYGVSSAVFPQLITSSTVATVEGAAESVAPPMGGTMPF